MLLACQDADAAQAHVRRMKLVALTPLTVTDPSAVIDQVARARERGYSVCDGELEVGVRSMAVAVFDRSGAAVAAMSIAVRADRLTLAEMTDTFLPALLRAQARVAQQLSVCPK